MSEELDRRIAEEVMGEPQPERPHGDAREMHNRWVTERPIYSDGGNWRWGRLPGNYIELREEEFVWKPLPFSTDLGTAMRAVDKYVADTGLEFVPNDFLIMGRALYDAPPEKRYSVYFSLPRSATGRTLPEAICNLLLALVKEGK